LLYRTGNCLCCFEQVEITGRSSAKVVIHIQVQQPLSSYADNPEGAANFMAPLLEKALDAVPADLQPETSIIWCKNY
jgi:acyl-CoA hydrolase